MKFGKIGGKEGVLGGGGGGGGGGLEGERDLSLTADHQNVLRSFDPELFPCLTMA